MPHKYYFEDTEQRKNYFTSQFLANAKLFAKNQGIPLEQVLGQVRDFESFKDVLEQVWSQDSSLLAYMEGMDESELEEFFNRSAIQKLVEEKIPEEEVIPDEVIQVEKKTQELFVSEIVEKETGIKRKVFAKKETVVVQGKKQQRYRDSKGRFAKRL